MGTARFEFGTASASCDSEVGREQTFGPAQSDDQHNLRDFLQIQRHITKMMKHRIMVVTAPTVTFVVVSSLDWSAYMHCSSSEHTSDGQLIILSHTYSFRMQMLCPTGAYWSKSTLLQPANKLSIKTLVRNLYCVWHKSVQVKHTHTSVRSVNYSEIQRLALGHLFLGDDYFSFNLNFRFEQHVLANRIVFGELVVLLSVYIGRNRRIGYWIKYMTAVYFSAGLVGVVTVTLFKLRKQKVKNC